MSLLASLLLVAGNAGALSEFGIEGMGVVSTAAEEARASVAPDGRHIVWASRRREGDAGGWDLWQAHLTDGRWQDPRRLPLNSTYNEEDPMFSADGRWLYFASDRPGGAGGHDLYRAAVAPGGVVGAAQALGAPINTGGNERAPAPGDGDSHLLFASDGFGGAGGLDLLVATRAPTGWTDPQLLAGINTPTDETGAAWIEAGRSIVFARTSTTVVGGSRLFVARCDGAAYAQAAPLALSFNVEGARTGAAGRDWSAPGELLLTGSAPAPRAGQGDIYRMKAPAPGGMDGCLRGSPADEPALGGASP
ncbi:MAG: TolB-like protein [Pseudomonadota bacterium]|nr:TolB-like protein [Pseudomonadota bacterium]